MYHGMLLCVFCGTFLSKYLYTKYSHQFTDRMSSLEFLFCIPRYFLSTARYLEKNCEFLLYCAIFYWMDGRDVPTTLKKQKQKPEKKSHPDPSEV